MLDWQLQEMPPDNWVVVTIRYQPETEETAGEIARVEHSSLGYRKLDIKQIESFELWVWRIMLQVG